MAEVLYHCGQLGVGGTGRKAINKIRTQWPIENYSISIHIGKGMIIAGFKRFSRVYTAKRIVRCIICILFAQLSAIVLLVTFHNIGVLP